MWVKFYKFVFRLLQELGHQQSGGSSLEDTSLISANNKRLNSLYERQNSKRDAREAKERTPRHGGDRLVRQDDRGEKAYSGSADSYDQQRNSGARRGEGNRGAPKTFERGDLRHSLRERRAARETSVESSCYNTV
jgi:hypothetical protein